MATTNENTIRDLADLAETVQEGLAVEVGVMLRAAQNLANCHRVLTLIELRADHFAAGGPSGPFGEELRKACQDWRDPIGADGHALVSDLLAVALRGFDRQVRNAETLASRLTELGAGLLPDGTPGDLRLVQGG